MVSAPEFSIVAGSRRKLEFSERESDEVEREKETNLYDVTMNTSSPSRFFTIVG